VVIKPLGNGILSQKGWVGTCVLGDGLPSLILNPTDLLESTISESTISQRRAA
jgi:chemotaxis protein histidine kinase CheA